VATYLVIVTGLNPIDGILRDSNVNSHANAGICICRTLLLGPLSGPMERRLPKIIRFSSYVLRDFFLRNHGLLLTAAVAYNMMLSLIPLSAVLMVLFSQFFDQALLMETITSEVSLIAPGFAPILTEFLVGFLDSRQLIGWLGLGSLLVFSSLAFRVMEDAIAIIFHRPLPTLKRKFWVSALMPYLFILIVAGGLIAVTTMNALIDALEIKKQVIFGVRISIHEHINHVIYTTGVLSLVLLFTLFYKLMPVAKISVRLALAGGLTATILWEIVRHLLVAYYTQVSMVNILYGSMATIIIVLLTMEAVALIILLGAQVIANLQGAANTKIPWHEDPDLSNPS
jgi:membrane protein